MSKELIRTIDESKGKISRELLQSVTGIGKAKASLLLAALEFARRRIHPRGIRIREAKDVYPLLAYLADRSQEHFVCISLNGAHEVIATRIVTIGLVNVTPVHPREVYCDPIKDRASAIIVAHNHPSGNLTPSAEDRKVTAVLKEAGQILGIKLIDHLIFGAREFYSFAEHGEL